jgi:hypothetical protein
MDFWTGGDVAHDVSMLLIVIAIAKTAKTGLNLPLNTAPPSEIISER